MTFTQEELINKWIYITRCSQKVFNDEERKQLQKLNDEIGDKILDFSTTYEKIYLKYN
jgi:aminoglycoside/choline kinase family phosphotransferase